jgi:hypothetical protein
VTDPETVTNPQVTFRSSDTSWAVVDENGVVKALPAGVGKTVYITAVTSNSMKAVIGLKITEDDPKPGPDQQGAAGDDGKKEQKQEPQPKEKGAKIVSEKYGAEFVVVSGKGETPAVAYKRSTDKKAKKIKVPETIEEEGITYTVTQIGSKAFTVSKAVTKIVIPKSVKKIGKQAFRGLPKLKKIFVKTTKLTGKTVAAKAFAGVGEKVIVKVPKAKKKAYQKLFQRKGLRGSVK